MAARKKSARKKKTTRRAATISLDDMIAVSSASAIKTMNDLKIGEKFKPIIWVGIWIEPFGPGDVRIPGSGGR